MEGLMAHVADDPEVRAAVKALALESLAQARVLVRSGAPSVKSRVVASVLPALVKGLGERQDTTTTDELRDQLDQLFAEMRGTPDGP